jgi:hypothetical protein
VSSTSRLAAILVLASVAGASAVSFADETPQRLGRTIVRQEDERLQAVLSWQVANERYREDRWLCLDLAVAPKKVPVTLRRGEVTLVLPEGTRVPLATAEQIRASKSRPIWGPPYRSRGGAELRDPLQDTYFRPLGPDKMPVEAPKFFVEGTDGYPEQIEAGPWRPFRGWLYFEPPWGKWPAGQYTLVLGSIGVELPFTLPADDPKRAPSSAPAAAPGL